MSSYLGQTGLICFSSSEKAAIMQWKTCKNATDCTSSHCVYALTDSHGNEIAWNGDKQGDLYVCQWNSGQVYPYKLHREG